MWIIYLHNIVIKKVIESFSSQRRDAQAIISKRIWPPLWGYVPSVQFFFPIYVYFLFQLVTFEVLSHQVWPVAARLDLASVLVTA